MPRQGLVDEQARQCAKEKQMSLTSEQVEHELTRLTKLFGELCERLTLLQKRVDDLEKAVYEEESDIMESEQ